MIVVELVVLMLVCEVVVLVVAVEVAGEGGWYC